MKSGEEVFQVWEKPGYSHLSPIQTAQKWFKPIPSPIPIPTKNTRLQISGCPINTLSNIQKLANFFFIKQIADKEGAEFAVAGADFVEAHFVDEFLELENIVSE